MYFNPDAVPYVIGIFLSQQVHKQNTMGKNFKYITGFFVIVMCLVLAYYLQFTALMLDRVYGNRRLIIVLMLVLYAIFRIFRLIIAYKKDKLDEKRTNF